MPILIVLMFLLGTDLNKESFTNVARNPRAVIVGMIGQLILLPLIAFSLAYMLKLPPVYSMMTGSVNIVTMLLIAVNVTDSATSPFANLEKTFDELPPGQHAMSTIPMK